MSTKQAHVNYNVKMDDRQYYKRKAIKCVHIQ